MLSLICNSQEPVSAQSPTHAYNGLRQEGGKSLKSRQPGQNISICSLQSFLKQALPPQLRIITLLGSVAWVHVQRVKNAVA